MADVSSGPRRLNSGARRKYNPMVVLAIGDAATRKDHANCLTESGFTVLDAACGEDARDLADRLLPEIVVVDFGLMGALGVARHVREHAMTKNVGVVGLCRGPAADWEQIGRRAGCDAVLAGPCEPMTLLTELLGLLAALEPAVQYGR
jgi:DNA-binding response OmpR family regulator